MTCKLLNVNLITKKDKTKEMTSYDDNIVECIADDYNNSLFNANEMTYSLLDIDGILHNPTMNTKELLNIIHHFKTKNDDTFVTTYVKAGTTWTQQIIHLLLRKGEPGNLLVIISYSISLSNLLITIHNSL